MVHIEENVQSRALQALKYYRVRRKSVWVFVSQLYGLVEVVHVVGFLQFFNSSKSTISGIYVQNFSPKYLKKHYGPELEPIPINEGEPVSDVAPEHGFEKIFNYWVEIVNQNGLCSKTYGDDKLSSEKIQERTSTCYLKNLITVKLLL